MGIMNPATFAGLQNPYNVETNDPDLAHSSRHYWPIRGRSILLGPPHDRTTACHSLTQGSRPRCLNLCSKPNRMRLGSTNHCLRTNCTISTNEISPLARHNSCHPASIAASTSLPFRAPNQ